MNLIQEGGCLCGAARYQINMKDAHTLSCHCRECQKHMGTPYSIFTVVPVSQFKWLTKPDSCITISERATRLFCGSCGTYLKWEGVDATNEAEINAMTLDDPTVLKIDEEIFTRTRLPWVNAVEGARQYKTTRS
ncbi:MAG: GFA family protein [Kordiimonas sp.]